MADHPLPENEDVEEASKKAETLPYMNEESNVSGGSEEDDPDTYSDRPTAVIAKKKQETIQPV